MHSWFLPLLLCLNLLILPFVGWLLVVSLAAIRARRPDAPAESPRSRFLIAIPAHDEEAGVADTVRCCLSVDYPADLFEVLVIADNCSDRTGEVARREGATVLERHDSVRKSKGYALEYMIEHLRDNGSLDRLDALVIVDADSAVSPGLLRGFASCLDAGRDWIQCFYTVANPDASWRTRLMAYAFSLFNGVMLLGQSALGLSAGFRGNGMCISTRGLQRVPWTTYGLVEDMEYSWTVRLAGGQIAFLPTERVMGVMLGQGGRAAASQRQRWESGRVQVKRKFTGPMLRSPRLGWLEKLTALIELTIPPLVFLASLCVLLVLANLALVVLSPPGATASAALIGLSLVSVLAIGIHAAAPFLAFGLPWHYLLVFPYVPIYALWKFVLAFKGRPTQWVRTPREPLAQHGVDAAR